MSTYKYEADNIIFCVVYGGIECIECPLEDKKNFQCVLFLML